MGKKSKFTNWLKSAYWPAVILVFILAFWLRTVGQNWDEGQGLHPDERFILMVAGSIETVKNFSDYFDTHNSSLNPHNKNFGFYVYGTVPLFLLRLAADIFTKIPLDILSRQIAAGFDLLSLTLIFLISLQFFGRLTALLAAFIYSCAVLPIQLSHYGTFDIHGAFFTVLVLFFSLQTYRYFSANKYYSQLKILLYAVLTGLAVALAGATKINLLACLGLFPLSILIAVWPGNGFYRSLKLSCIYSIFTALVVCLGFRFFQPIAFNGPSYWDFSLNEKWLENINQLLNLSKPSVHFPPAVQWIDRTRMHSFLNIITWGLGLPLGIFSLIASVYAFYRIVFRKDLVLVLPVVWLLVGLALFSFMPLAQPMRYSVPVFSTFAIISAVLASKMLVGTYPWMVSRWSETEQLVARSFVYTVLFCTFLWSLSFVQIYINANSRIAASRWIIQNIPAALSFEMLDGSRVGVPIAADNESLVLPAKIGFWPSKDFAANKVFIPKLKAQNGSFIEFKIVEDSKVIAKVNHNVTSQSITVGLAGLIEFRHGTHYLLEISAENAQILKFNLGNETSWDDSLPQRIDGVDPYGGLYAGKSNLELYWTDYQEKAARMAKALSQADYFYLSSNRQVGTVGRLPEVFPIAALFYQRLLGCSRREYIPECYATAKAGERQGDLGFRLVKTFSSYPKLFGIEFNTQLADESFHVYDHPKVLIFKNEERFSAEEIQKRITPARLEPREMRD